MLPIFFFLLSPSSPQSPPVDSCIFQLWVSLVVACGTLPQHGLMSSAMSVPRIRTYETLGCLSRACKLSHWATGPAPSQSFLMKSIIHLYKNYLSQYIRFFRKKNLFQRNKEACNLKYFQTSRKSRKIIKNSDLHGCRDRRIKRYQRRKFVQFYLKGLGHTSQKT